MSTDQDSPRVIQSNKSPETLEGSKLEMNDNPEIEFQGTISDVTDRLSKLET